jgi:ankyrin repeat protein
MSVHSICSRLITFICIIASLSYPCFSYANPALLQAAESGNLEGVRAELSNDADVNFTLPNSNPKYGYLVHTALENAASKGHTDVVVLLLANGAKVRADDWYGLYAATSAGQAGYAAILTILLGNTDPEPEHLDKLFGPALINTARNGRTEAVAILLERGVSPNWHTPGDHFPRPAILEAQRSGQEKIFSTLMEAGGDPKPYPEILTLTAMQGDTAMVERLLSMGMDPNDDSEIGLPLSMAACAMTASNPEYQARINATVAVLLEANSEVNVPARGRSPLFCATEDRNEALIAMLQSRGARSFETAGRKLKRLGWQTLFTLGSH